MIPLLDQIDRHFTTIFLVWSAAFGAATVTAVRTKTRWLQRVCTSAGVVLLAAPLVYLASLMLSLLVFLVTH
jgi:hypothetical protein